ncbi:MULTISPECIES: CvpA family protein [Myroides]|uniref:CvpA family protein n=1 Tax=Myroides albus TaxID=2562892 RepID=A0A6I3LP24_9FLAO|nr:MULTISPECIES: CvpA family protein [Myroides]MTG97922.1 CvpA family protein [Myroides albus]MVX37308.1 CvpA family protein [Myroides sp. LoEW2-1]UVD81110.1 CvpA family protein [Myroides albus]
MVLDIITGIVLVYGIYIGLKKGLFVSVAAFLSILIGIIGALKFSNVVKELLFTKLGWDTSFLPIISFILTFFLSILLVKFVANMLTKVFETVYLGFVNRLFGALFQILVVILVGSVFLSLFDEVNNIFKLVETETLQQSYSYKTYLVLSEDILPSLYNMVKSLFARSVDMLTTPEEPTAV